MDIPVAQAGELSPDDQLVLPLSKGAFAQYREEPGRPRELRIFHRHREIAFADPALFGFGETLIRQTRFRAGDAVGWGRLAWPRVRGLLEQLIGAGVLRRADESEAAEAPLRHEERPSPLRPAPCARPMTWDESEAIMRRLAGRPIETGHIELVVPIFRVAHMYLDSDDRQIGEANVFPPPMRLERPTLWRTCTYSGSRYQPDRPMNVTALRVMRAHWRQMMAIVRRVSDSYRARFPAVGERGWTVGDIERLTVCVIALPTYLLMRRERRVGNGRLHPAIASAFRLTDGPRTALHNMVFADLGEPARSDGSGMTAAELHAYAERNQAFHSPRGVCAGPPAMIDDFLAVMLEGADPKGGWPAALDPEVAEALGETGPAIDYGLAGLQAYCAVYSLFPASAAAASAMLAIVRRRSGAESPGLAELRSRLEAAAGSAPADSAPRRLAAYDDLHRQCGLGLTGRPPDPSLIQRIESGRPLPAPALEALDRAFELRLRDLAGGKALAAELAACLGRFVGTVQAILRAALEAQDRINALLGRDPPGRPFTGRDLAAGPFVGRDLDQYRPAGEGRAPFLVDDLAALLGIAIEIGADRVTIGPAEAVRSPGE